MLKLKFQSLKISAGLWLTNVTRKLSNNFYLYLATLITLAILVDAGVFHIGENMRDKAFDVMVKNRIFTPKPDNDIVIVDVNEASLSALAKDYGRWPWPRQVFGEFVENIEAQHPKAIVFDILFSDADIYNPDSDAYFNDVIKTTNSQANNVFFPFLRLAPEQDHLSLVKPYDIPGILAAPLNSKSQDSQSQTNPKASIAVVLPHFEAVLNTKHLGTHNIDPDKDGIVREYKLYRDEYGYRLPSLPLIVGNYARTEPDKYLSQNMLMNWRGKPFTYQYVTFSDVMTDMGSKVKTRAPNEFTNKIVIIGSTAPSLFDLKATAMAKAHPGVEILATAIDNVKHSDYLHVWRGAFTYVLLSLMLVWLTTAAFFFNIDRDRFNKLFSASQVGLLALSYIGINMTNFYLDFTAPIIWAVAYFSIAKIYALATDRALQRWLAFGIKANGQESQAVLIMPILIESRESLTDTTLKQIKRHLALKSHTPNTVDILKGLQNGLWGLFGDMVIVVWIYAADKPEYAQAAKKDAVQLSQQLENLMLLVGLPKDTEVRYTLHDGIIANEKMSGISSAKQWRSLFAQSVIKLEHEDVKPV